MLKYINIKIEVNNNCKTFYLLTNMVISNIFYLKSEIFILGFNK